LVPVLEREGLVALSQELQAGGQRLGYGEPDAPWDIQPGFSPREGGRTFVYWVAHPLIYTLWRGTESIPTVSACRAFWEDWVAACENHGWNIVDFQNWWTREFFANKSQASLELAVEVKLSLGAKSLWEVALVRGKGATARMEWKQVYYLQEQILEISKTPAVGAMWKAFLESQDPVQLYALLDLIEEEQLGNQDYLAHIRPYFLPSQG
jgi:hypothetical protein